MAMKTKIFLLSRDPETIESVKRVAQNGSPIEVDAVFSDVAAAETYLKSSGVTAGLVDIDPNGKESLTRLESLVAAHPHLCAVVLSQEISQELILRAMEAGARHYLQKGTIQRDLSGVMSRLLSQANLRGRQGSVLTVFSAGGGCGATTVALNLAMEMRMSTGKPALLIDLDRCYGAAAAYLDLKSRYGVDDVLGFDGRIDSNLIRSSSCSYLEDFHVLLSPAGKRGLGTPPGPIPSETLRSVLQACRQAYGYTVIDAPRLDEETVKCLSELSDFTIVVFQMTLKDLKHARSILSTIKETGVPEQKIIPLVNRFERRGAPIKPEDGRKVLGIETLYRIRSDWRNAMNCQTKGKTLAEAAPRSKMRKDFVKLVNELQNKPKD